MAFVLNGTEVQRYAELLVRQLSLPVAKNLEVLRLQGLLSAQNFKRFRERFFTINVFNAQRFHMGWRLNGIDSEVSFPKTQIRCRKADKKDESTPICMSGPGNSPFDP